MLRFRSAEGSRLLWFLPRVESRAMDDLHEASSLLKFVSLKKMIREGLMRGTPNKECKEAAGERVHQWGCL